MRTLETVVLWYCAAERVGRELRGESNGIVRRGDGVVCVCGSHCCVRAREVKESCHRRRAYL